MELLRKLEKTVAPLYRDVPHLPIGGRKWLAQNAWWLVAVIAGIMGAWVVGILLLTLLLGSLLTGLAGVAGAIAGGAALVVVLLSTGVSLVQVVLLVMAVRPLKALQEKGWYLVFAALAIRLAAEVLSFLFTFNILSLLWDVVVVAIILYFLREVRSELSAKETKPVKVAPKKPLKAA